MIPIHTYFKRGDKARLTKLAGVSNRTMQNWLNRGYLPTWAAFVADLKLGIPAQHLMEPNESALFQELVDSRIKQDRSIQ